MAVQASPFLCQQGLAREVGKTIIQVMLCGSITADRGWSYRRYNVAFLCQVDAEQFDSATVFFSDIADFHDISVNSFPIDIIHFLNELYNFMDKEIVKYDVYKVK